MQATRLLINAKADLDLQYGSATYGYSRYDGGEPVAYTVLDLALVDHHDACAKALRASGAASLHEAAAAAAAAALLEEEDDDDTAGKARKKEKKKASKERLRQKKREKNEPGAAGAAPTATPAAAPAPSPAASRIATPAMAPAAAAVTRGASGAAHVPPLPPAAAPSSSSSPSTPSAPSASATPAVAPAAALMGQGVNAGSGAMSEAEEAVRHAAAMRTLHTLRTSSDVDALQRALEAVESQLAALPALSAEVGPPYAHPYPNRRPCPT